MSLLSMARIKKKKIGDRAKTFAKWITECIWGWLYETFPERQWYIRSDGRVQFFVFGPMLQATLSALSLIFLGWVAFATVNFVFKDQIIRAKDHRYQEMQSAYENRMADLQLSYDELSPALVASLSVQNKAIACINSECEPATRRQLKKAFDAEVFTLHKIGVSLGALDVPKAEPQNQSKLRSGVSSAMYVATKDSLDALFSFFTGKSGSKLSDETAFHILFLLCWGAVSAFFLLAIRFLGKLVLNGTRRQRPDKAPLT